jgi:predicted nuclease of predicted toxin-antitoxin system
VQRLFIELYLDEDVDILIAQLLRARGFVAATTLEAGNLQATDDQQLAYAAAHGMAFLTHNRADFEALHQAYVASGREHAGLIIAVRRSPYDVARRLLLILNQVTADEMHNQIRYI